MEQRVAQLEAMIASTEEDLARMTAEMSDPEVAKDAARIERLAADVAAAQAKIADHTAEWERLSLDLES